MRKLFFIPFLFLPLTTMAACSSDDTPAPQTEQSTTHDDTDNPSGNSKTLVAYFSAQGHTQAVAKRIVELTGADIYRIEAPIRMPKIHTMTATVFRMRLTTTCVPEWRIYPIRKLLRNMIRFSLAHLAGGHQPAMVVCTFLEAYDLKDKVVIPFFTYGATTYLNESMQKIYKVTPESKHLPETLPEDLNPDDITTPGPPDDAGIDMPGGANGTEAWLRRIGIIK